MMKGMFKKALAGVAAAALAITGFAAATTTANAASGDIELGTKITFVAGSTDQFIGRYLKYVKLASFTELYAENAASTLQVMTESNVRDAIINALTEIEAEYNSSTDGDPMTWVMNNLEGDSTSDAVAYDSELRKFVTALSIDESLWSDVTLSDGENDTEKVFDTDEPGIYLIRDNATASGGTGQAIPMLVSTPVSVKDSADPEPEITKTNGQVNLKNEITTVEKTVDDSSAVSVGGKKTYTITANVPNWTGKTGTLFTFTDTPTKGQTVLFDTIKVMIMDSEGEEVVVEDFFNETMLTKPTGVTSDEWKATYDPANDDEKDDSNSFTVDLTSWMNENYSSYQGYTVQLTYTVKINSDALAEGASVYNDVKINNNGATSEDSTSDTPIKTPATIKFTKVQGDKTTPLEGAKFKVQVKVDDGYVDLYQNADGEWSVANDENPATVFESLSDGIVTIPGLGKGNYRIVETETVDGYWEVLPSFEFSVDKSGSVTVDYDSNNLLDLVQQNEAGQTIVINVQNITQLPQTGAAGIALFIVLGLLIAGAGVTVYMKSRSVRNALRG